MSSPSSSPITTLTTLQQTLHLLHHRNKNQHRLAKWYKSLSQFRRQIPKLTAEIEAYEAARAIKEESAYVMKARDALRARIEFLRERCVGRWYLAFTNVISDNQWSAIGLMLLGSLARFRGVLNEVGREIGLEEETIEEDKIEDISGAKEDPMKVDLGEVIDRNSLRKPGAGGGVASQNQEEDAEVKKKEKKKRKEAVSDEQKAETVESTSTPAKRPKKKRKKGGDAFDDLFDSLM